MEPCGSKSPFSTKALEIVLRGYQSPTYPETAVCTVSKNLYLSWKCFLDTILEIRDSGYDFGSGSIRHCWCSVNKRVWVWRKEKIEEENMRLKVG